MAQDEDDRRAILARRKRFIAMALVGTTAAATGTACSCLSPPTYYDAYSPDASRQDAGSADGGALDASSDASSRDADSPDAIVDVADSEPPDAP